MKTCPKSSFYLPYVLKAIKHLSDTLDNVYMLDSSETTFRLLSEIEVTAHELSVTAAKMKNHPFNYKYHEKKVSKNSKLQGAPWRNTPVEKQVTALVLDFGLVEVE